MPSILRFRLRTLLVLTALCASAAGLWTARHVAPYRRQARSIAWLSDRGFIIDSVEAGPAWVRSYAGDDYLREAVSARCDEFDKGFTREHWARIAQFSSLQDLRIPGAIHIENLGALARLTKLKRLDACFSYSFGDAGLKHVARLRDIEQLDLVQCSITDAGLAATSGLTQLRRLNLSCNDVSSDGLRHLQPLRRLEALDLEGTNVADLAQLGDKPRLTELDLAATLVDSDAVAALRRFPDLSRLTLRNTNVDDRVVETLVALPRLSYVDLSATRVTDLGEQSLSEKLPKLAIVRFDSGLPPAGDESAATRNCVDTTETSLPK